MSQTFEYEVCVMGVREEQALMVVVRLEEGVEQVEKVVPPSSFS